MSVHASITRQMQEALEKFHEASQADDRVVAAFVGGSIAQGTADQYSDLDLYLVIADDEYDNFFAGRRAFLESLGEVVYLGDFDGFGFDLVLFVMATGVKGELGLGTTSRYSNIHGGPYTVVVDKTGLLEGAVFPLLEDSPETRAHKVERDLGSFWRQLLLFCMAMGRGHLVTASEYLREAQAQLLRLASMSAQAIDDSKRTDRLPPSLTAEYARTFFRLERDSMLDAARQAGLLIERVGSQLAGTHGVAYPGRLAEVVWRELGTALRVGDKGGQDPSSLC